MIRPGLPCSFAPQDVRLLVDPVHRPTLSAAEREQRLSAGESYGRMLGAEALPSEPWLAFADAALRMEAGWLLGAIRALAAEIAAGPPLVLLSILRAGLAVGVALTRALRRMGVAVRHYGISAIRETGLDPMALAEVQTAHPEARLWLVDGWTGAGRMAAALQASGLPLLVLADPAGVADLAATREDRPLPFALLNAPIAGLISRTLLPECCGARHGAMALPDLAPADRSGPWMAVLEAAEPEPVHPARGPAPVAVPAASGAGARQKLGFGETLRALQRRVPAEIWLDPALSGWPAEAVTRLAADRGIPVRPPPEPLQPWRAAALFDARGEDPSP